jgi:hypothetical protein
MHALKRLSPLDSGLITASLKRDSASSSQAEDQVNTQPIKPVCVHANTVEVSAFIYDQIRCRDCGAYIGRV